MDSVNIVLAPYSPPSAFPYLLSRPISLGPFPIGERTIQSPVTFQQLQVDLSRALDCYIQTTQI